MEGTLGEEHVFVKWLERRDDGTLWSPGWGGPAPVQYVPGETVDAEGEVSDQQCAPGLHVFRVGEWPEWHGLRDPGHDLVPWKVRVRSEDILFAGVATMNAKLRVRRLTMFPESASEEWENLEDLL